MSIKLKFGLRSPILLIIAYLIVHSWQQDVQYCQNDGQKILVRSKNPPYTLKLRCLCPFNYYGDNCQWLRQMLCFMDNQKILRYNPDPNQNQNRIDLSLMFQCVFRHLDPKIIRRQRFKTNNFDVLPIDYSVVQRQQKQYNYNMGPDYDIVWANSSAIFNQFGEIIRNQSQGNLTDQQILDSFPHYKFQKHSEFLGIPLFNSQVKFWLKVELFNSVRGLFLIDDPQLTFTEVKIPSLTQNSTKFLITFSVNLKRQWQQYSVTRLQLLVNQSYNLKNLNRDATQNRRICMRCARWVINDPYYTPGERIQNLNNSKIPGSFLVILSFIGVFAFIWSGKTFVKLFKRWRNKKNLAFLQQQNDVYYEYNEEEDTYAQSKQK